jgi:hypothetical protein
VIAGDPVVAGQGNLQSSSQAGAVDGGHNRLLKGLQTAHRLLTLEAQPFGFGLIGNGRELFYVGAGNEGVGLAGDEHNSAGGGVLAETGQQGLKLGLDCGVELVDWLTGEVEGHDRDSVLDLAAERRPAGRVPSRQAPVRCGLFSHGVTRRS